MATEPAGRDIASLGPNDNSDSGSDMAGLDEPDVNDPTEPVDVALRDDAHRKATASDNVPGSRSDSGGTGQGRSAGQDAGGREGNDIWVDRVFSAVKGADGDVASHRHIADVDNSAAGHIRAPNDDEEADNVDEADPDMTEEDDVAVDGDGDPDSGIEDVPITRERNGA